MTQTIIFLTAAFPFEGGEQFIESEIPYWEGHDVNLVIMPLSAKGKARPYPKNVTVDKCLINNLSPYVRFKGVFSALFSFYLIKEIYNLGKVKKLTLTNIILALKTISFSFSVACVLRKRNKSYMADSLYSYWNDSQAFSGCILKDKGVVNKVFTRCHGYDLYEYRRNSNYSPLKRLFRNSFDKWFVICNSAKNYLIEKYHVDSECIELARLGVDIPLNRSKYSQDGVLNLLSVSYCIEVKRIDKIILALQAFSTLHPSQELVWTHIGSGPLLSKLETQSQSTFKNTGIKFKFLGNISNSEVKKYYQNNIIDFFINTSASEGVPVSIMEAMSYGVPVIAPDVGGVSELLEPKSCFLLANNPSVENIVAGIEFMNIESSKLSNRELCQFKISAEYSAEVNFTKFIKGIINND